MTPHSSAAGPLDHWTPDQYDTLAALRQAYQAHADLFWADELARLIFLRWLHQTGRLVP
jgi:hypothetical protein